MWNFQKLIYRFSALQRWLQGVPVLQSYCCRLNSQMILNLGVVSMLINIHCFKYAFVVKLSVIFAVILVSRVWCKMQVSGFVGIQYRLCRDYLFFFQVSVSNINGITVFTFHYQRVNYGVLNQSLCWNTATRMIQVVIDRLIFLLELIFVWYSFEMILVVCSSTISNFLKSLWQET